MIIRNQPTATNEFALTYVVVIVCSVIIWEVVLLQVKKAVNP